MQHELYVTTMQERQMAACAFAYDFEPLIPLTVVDGADLREPLERSRVYNPDASTVSWLIQNGRQLGALVTFGFDANGQVYAEY